MGYTRQYAKASKSSYSSSNNSSSIPTRRGAAGRFALFGGSNTTADKYECKYCKHTSTLQSDIEEHVLLTHSEQIEQEGIPLAQAIIAPQRVAQHHQQQQQIQVAAVQEAKLKDVEIDTEYIVDTSFYAHYFFAPTEQQQIVQPRHSLAKVHDASTGKTDHYLSVSFPSKYDGAGIAQGRPDISLVVCLDISGSMSCAFEDEAAAAGETMSKMKAAKECLLNIIAQLRPNDSFGLVVFNEKATVIQPLTKWTEMDITGLSKQIAKLRPGGGTTISEGMKASAGLYNTAKVESSGNSSASVSKRIFFLTDMEVGREDGQSFVTTVTSNSNDALWTTVVGVGLDLSQNVIEQVSKTPGANYCNVRSTKNFKDLMDKEFGYLIAPVAFNIDIELKSTHFSLGAGYGSPEISGIKPGQKIAHLATEFPVIRNEKGERKPFGYLFKLNVAEGSTGTEKFIMHVKYENEQGLPQQDVQEIAFPAEAATSFQDNGIRKAILLLQYADLAKEFMTGKKTLNKLKEAKFNEKLLLFLKHYKNERAVLDDETLKTEEGNLINMYKFLGGQEADYEAPVAQASASSSSEVPAPAPVAPAEAASSAGSSAAAEAPAVAPQPVPQVAVPAAAGGSNNEEDLKCVICMANNKNVCLVPCRHVCVCKECSQKVEDCPLCRTKIDNKLDVFL